MSPAKPRMLPFVNYLGGCFGKKRNRIGNRFVFATFIYRSFN